MSRRVIRSPAPCTDPHPARYAGHPPRKGEGKRCLQAPFVASTNGKAAPSQALMTALQSTKA